MHDTFTAKDSDDEHQWPFRAHITSLAFYAYRFGRVHARCTQVFCSTNIQIYAVPGLETGSALGLESGRREPTGRNRGTTPVHAIICFRTSTTRRVSRRSSIPESHAKMYATAESHGPTETLSFSADGKSRTQRVHTTAFHTRLYLEQQ